MTNEREALIQGLIASAKEDPEATIMAMIKANIVPNVGWVRLDVKRKFVDLGRKIILEKQKQSMA